MLLKFQESRSKREEGFTLIELLVVVIIIGILAAIAIPVFLNQRQKAWDSAVQSDLKNAATAQETYLTENDAYTDDVTDLANVGFNQGADIVFSHMQFNGGQEYCMEAFHNANSDSYWLLDSNTGEPVSASSDDACSLGGSPTNNTSEQTAP